MNKKTKKLPCISGLLKHSARTWGSF